MAGGLGSMAPRNQQQGGPEGKDQEEDKTKHVRRLGQSIGEIKR